MFDDTRLFPVDVNSVDSSVIGSKNVNSQISNIQDMILELKNGQIET